MVVEIALRLQQLHADVDVLILLLQVVLDEHCLQDDLRVSVRCIEAHLVIKYHDCVGVEYIGALQRHDLSLVAL